MSKIKSTDYTFEINQVLSESYFQHHSRSSHNPPRNKYSIIEDHIEECREIVVHSFFLSDVDDPDIYAAGPLIEWEKSEKGQWVMKNAVDSPTWHRTVCHHTYGYKYQIRAKLIGPRLTEWFLRYGK